MAGQGGKNSGIIQTLVAIVREEGFAVLYRGIGGPLGVEPIKRAVKFTTQAYYASIAPAGLLGQFISGALAGMTEVIVIAPTEIVKVRLQSKDYKSIYKSGTVDAMKQIVRDEGPLTLLKGLEAGLWRQGVYNGSLFGWTALFKQLWTEPAGYGAGLWRNFVCGAVAGTLGVSSFNIPFDVVCTRNRNLPRGTPALWAWCAPTPPLAHDSSRTCSYTWLLQGIHLQGVEGGGVRGDLPRLHREGLKVGPGRRRDDHGRRCRQRPPQPHVWLTAGPPSPMHLHCSTIRTAH